MFVLRKYCRSIFRPWGWKVIARIEDETGARDRFNRVSGHYSDTCRGYELVSAQGAVMSAWDYRR